MSFARLSMLCAGLCLALLAAWAPSAGAQTAFVVRQHVNGSYSLYAIDLTTGDASIATSQLAFLPTPLVGHPVSARLRSDRPWSLDGPAPGIRLPLHGSLHRVTRAGVTAMLHLRTDGSASLRASTAEVDGPGLLPGVGIDTTGSRALLATPVASGGDVLLLDLGTDAPAVNLTALLVPLDVAPDSLRVGADGAWFVAEGALYHVDLLSNTNAQPIALPLQTGEVLLPELAVSGDGRGVAVVTELSANRRRLMVVDSAGAVSIISGNPGPLDTPGYDDPTGPLLVLSDDALCVAWRRTQMDARELFVQRLDQAPTPVQVTSDANFTDTIDNVGVLGFIADTLLVFSAGELPGLGDPLTSVGSADVFLMDTATQDLTNLTGTSGQTLPPFLVAGELEIQAATLSPDSSRLLLEVDPDGGDVAMLSVPLGGAQSVSGLTGPLLASPILLAAGEHVLLITEPELPSGDPTQQLVLSPAGGAPMVLGSVPPGVTLDRMVASRDGTSAALVASAGPGLELLVRVALPSGLLSLAWDQPFDVTSALGFSTDGQLLAGLGVAGGPYIFGAFPQAAAAQKLAVPKGVGFALTP
ncbi:MAG: hypothetical protein DRQ55_00675 [Planctomycetota bacterium]|nr:MAG: hypothetical protein DRQ55_00675 [Planctomycetota bacterium]